MKVFKKFLWMLAFPFVWMILGCKWLSIKRMAKNYNKDRSLYPDYVRYKKILSFIKWFLYAKQITIEKSGKEKLDGKKLFYVINHKSNLDALVVLRTILGQETPLPVFVAKIELATSKLAPAFDLLDVIYIDRENLRQTVEAINQEIDTLNQTKSIAIFPEGTRIPEVDKFGEFKPAALTPAYKTLTAIQPIVIYNSTDLLSQSSARLNRTAYIKFLNTIQPLNFVNIDKEIFSANLQKNMFKEYLELKKEIEARNE